MKNAQTKTEKKNEKKTVQNTIIRTTRAVPVQLFLAELSTVQIIDMVAQLFAQHASVPVKMVAPRRPPVQRVRNKAKA